ncbi:hypothetical protein DFH09DRAFT_1073151 [Mycena vulgaris]|nr:hypothetical protein DFH09DRAFT_1073151 [Mycena vulgaris]
MVPLSTWPLLLATHPLEFCVLLQYFSSVIKELEGDLSRVCFFYLVLRVLNTVEYSPSPHNIPSATSTPTPAPSRYGLRARREGLTGVPRRDPGLPRSIAPPSWADFAVHAAAASPSSYSNETEKAEPGLDTTTSCNLLPHVAASLIHIRRHLPPPNPPALAMQLELSKRMVNLTCDVADPSVYYSCKYSRISTFLKTDILIRVNSTATAIREYKYLLFANGLARIFAIFAIRATLYPEDIVVEMKVVSVSSRPPRLPGVAELLKKMVGWGKAVDEKLTGNYSGCSGEFGGLVMEEMCKGRGPRVNSARRALLHTSCTARTRDAALRHPRTMRAPFFGNGRVFGGKVWIGRRGLRSAVEVCVEAGRGRCFVVRPHWALCMPAPARVLVLTEGAGAALSRTCLSARTGTHPQVGDTMHSYLYEVGCCVPCEVTLPSRARAAAATGAYGKPEHHTLNQMMVTYRVMTVIVQGRQ